jgi:hypothetical protein
LILGRPKPNGHDENVIEFARRPSVKTLADNSSFALRIWRESINPRGTLVEQYLRSLSLDLPSEVANEVIRFHPYCLFGSERFPAMVCLVRHIRTDEPQGIQRTALAPDGTAFSW